MTEKNENKPTFPFGVRLGLCIGLAIALTASNGAGVGIAVAAGVWLVLTFGSRRCKISR